MRNSTRGISMRLPSSSTFVASHKPCFVR
jgi:hypothetical protein